MASSIFRAATRVSTPIRRRGQRVLGALSYGVNDLLPPLTSNVSVFYAPVVTAPYALEAELFTNTNGFPVPIVSATYGVDAPYVDDSADTFYAAEIVQGQTLLVNLFDDTDTFYAASIDTGAFMLTAALFTDDDTFYDVYVGRNVSAPLTTNDNEFYEASVGITVYAPYVVNANAFYAASVVSILSPELFVNDSVFHSPQLTTANNLVVALFTDADTIYDFQIGQGQFIVGAGISLTDDDMFFQASVRKVGFNYAAARLGAYQPLDPSAYHNGAWKGVEEIWTHKTGWQQVYARST